MRSTVRKRNLVAAPLRFFAAALTFLFLVFSSGLAVSVHYCGGKATSIKLVSASSCACGKAQASCCKDKTSVFKIDHSFTKSAVNHVLSQDFQVAATVPSATLAFIPPLALFSSFRPVFSPPDPPSCPIYLFIGKLSI